MLSDRRSTGSNEAYPLSVTVKGPSVRDNAAARLASLKPPAAVDGFTRFYIAGWIGTHLASVRGERLSERCAQLPQKQPSARLSRFESERPQSPNARFMYRMAAAAAW
jgi:hypothetical protein